MLIDYQSSLAEVSNLRHELRTPINVILGYSEMILEDLAVMNDDQNLSEIELIRNCAIELMDLIKKLLNDKVFEQYQSDLGKLLAEQTVQEQMIIPTNLVIESCQKIINTENNLNFSSDIKKINKAAQNLLVMINNLSK